MDYKKHYDSLITKARTRETIDGYKERHHIVPRCLGGKDSNNNIVELTAREHFIAHLLLYKWYSKIGSKYTSKLAFAIYNFVNGWSNNNHERIDLSNNRQYEKLRIEATKYLSEHNKALWEDEEFRSKRTKQIQEQNSSPEYKKYMSEVLQVRMKDPKTRQKMTDSSRAFWDTGSDRSKELSKERSNRFKGIPKTKEHKAKIGRKGMTMIQNKNTLEIKRVLIEEYESMDKHVWVNPRKITPEKKHKCSVCGLETTMGNLTRWHNENCGKKDTWESWTTSNHSVFYQHIEELYAIFNSANKELKAKAFGIEITELINNSNNSVLIDYSYNRRHLVNKLIKKFKDNYNPLEDSNWIKFKDKEI